MSLYESIKENIDKWDIINPEDKDYADGHLMRVCLWSGAGYDLAEFYVYIKGDDAQAALEKTVAYCEQNGYTGFILDTNEIEDMAEKDYAEEVANYDGDLDEFITNYLNYVYVDATMDGATKPYYVYGENLRIENVE